MTNAIRFSDDEISISRAVLLAFLCKRLTKSNCKCVIETTCLLIRTNMTYMYLDDESHRLCMDGWYTRMTELSIFCPSNHFRLITSVTMNYSWRFYSLSHLPPYNSLSSALRSLY